MQGKKKIGIVGSGLVGTLLAIYLKRLGNEVVVFDRRPDMRKVGFSGRSINLAISDRGWTALKEAGIDQEIRALAIPMFKRAIHVVDKPLYYQPYGQRDQAIYSISRGLLNGTMIDLAESRGISFRFSEKIWDIDLQQACIYAGEGDKKELTPHQFDLVFGADGAFSRIRHKMQRQSRFNYSQHFLKVGYKELRIPPKADGSHKLEKNSFHIWPRKDFMLIAMPNLDGSFTSTLFLPFEGKYSFENLNTQEKTAAFFDRFFPDVKDEIENLTQDFFKNPTSSMVTIKCYPWIYQDKVALIGDASHAVVPFYGQGMNAGFEDVKVLKDLLEFHEFDWRETLQDYQRQRKPQADAIAELSYQNFLEMSSDTADEEFLLRKKIEGWFADLHPEKWIPLYSRVTFSNKPYTEAIQEGARQNEIMDEIMKDPEIKFNWKTPQTEAKILNLLRRSEDFRERSVESTLFFSTVPR